MNQINIMSTDAVRVLAADAVQKAKSGHLGLPLGSAPIAYELQANHMNHSPRNPQWKNRGHFVLSGDHGSTLLYSLLHLSEYDLTKEDMMNFRQTSSLIPGHPEYGHTVGAKATMGPLDTGASMTMGMAMAEAHLSTVFNEDGYSVVGHCVYVLGKGGRMMEGILSKVFSLVGALGFGKLIVFYDSNQVSVEGGADIAFIENVQKYMKASDFQLLMIEDGNDLSATGRAIQGAKADTVRPSFITVKTQVGYDCPARQGKTNAHGGPLGGDNVTAMKEDLDWPSIEPFYIPDEVYANYKAHSEKGAETGAERNVLFDKYCGKYPEMEELWDKFYNPELGDEVHGSEGYWAYDEKPDATRNLSGKQFQRLKNLMSNLISDAAGLALSTKTYMVDMRDFPKDNYARRDLYSGVRELAMVAISDGLMPHGGLRASVSTFFVFSDYTKPMTRLSVPVGVPLTFVLTHDSIGVGKDGPIHELIEQLAMLHSVSNLHVFHPTDATEAAATWYSTVSSSKVSTALVPTRQNLPQLTGSDREALRGAYILGDSVKGAPDATIIVTDSETRLIVGTKAELTKEGMDVCVVGMSSMDVFEEQPEEYKEAVLPKTMRKRVAVEVLGNFGWGRYVGLDRTTVTIKNFGASAPAGQLSKRFGFTAENVVAAVRSLQSHSKEKRR